jgi:hypothetical protein
MHVLDRGNQFPLAAKRSLVVTLLPYLAASSGNSIVPVGEASLDQSHDPVKLLLGWSAENEMYVVRHYNEGQKPKSCLVAHFRDNPQQ